MKFIMDQEGMDVLAVDKIESIYICLNQKGAINKMQIKADDFGTLAICALRYCMGRQTYMPGAVRGIIRPRLSDMSDRDIKVMWQDCERQREYETYGNPVLDKPDWLEWAETIRKEKERRNL